MLNRRGANALYVEVKEGEEGVLIVRESASPKAIMEELHHLEEHRLIGFRKLTTEDILRMENKAQEALLAYGKLKGWTKAELEALEQNQKYWQEKQERYKTHPEEVEEEVNVLMNRGEGGIYKKLDADGSTIYVIGERHYRVRDGICQKWDGSEWKQMHGMDETRFETMLGEKWESVSFKGTADEIKQQELLEQSKKNDIYKPNPKHDPNSEDYGGRKASVEPDNVIELWSKRSCFDGKNWWSIQGTGKDAIFTRFAPDNTGTYHFNGASNGKNKWNQPTPLEAYQIPEQVKNLAKNNK